MVKHIKIVIIGDALVGKTSFMLRFIEEKYFPRQSATIGLNYRVKTFKVEEKDVRLQIWDTAGQERFRILAPTFYRSAKGIILAYDSTKQSSFDNIKYWVGEITKNLSEQVPKVLVATKADLDPTVTKEMGLRLAREVGCEFFETSALTGEGIFDVFNSLVNDIFKTDYLDTNSISLSRRRTDTRETCNCCLK